MGVRFERLSAAKKRVRIARDVLAQLKLETIRAKSGIYFEYTLYPMESISPTEDVSTAVSKGGCDVCAVGSLFVAAVKRADKLKVGDAILRDSDPQFFHVPVDMLFKYVKQFFGEEQLRLIEIAFEGSSTLRENMAPLHRRAAGMFWVSTCEYTGFTHSPRERMEAIMRNIIRNGGRFIPSKTTLEAPRRKT